MKKTVLNAIVFLFPLFFLTFTEDFFTFNKLYLLVVFALFIIITSSYEIIKTKKIIVSSSSSDLPVIFFVASIALSTLISSSNKIQAIYDPQFGLMTFIILTTIYFYVSRLYLTEKEIGNIRKTFQISVMILSIISIIVYFEPFKQLFLPDYFAFLNNRFFTPAGNIVDLIFFISLSMLLSIENLILVLLKKKPFDKNELIFNLLSVILLLAGLFLPVFSIMKQGLLALPPFYLSWHALLETMKSLKTAVFGIGIDNFTTVFTKIKDPAFSQSSLWKIRSFNYSSSVILHTATEAGLTAFFSLVYLLASFVMSGRFLILSIFLTVILFVTPPFLTVFTVLFFVLGLVSKNINNKKEIDLSETPTVYFTVSLIILALSLTMGYFSVRLYQGEVFFKKSIDSLDKKDLKKTYNSLKTARLINPYSEKYALNFSQINLLVADSISKKEKDKITEADRTSIAQAIQTAIAEAKYLVALNPNKSQHYENLGYIYRNIINLAKGSDTWSIASYQRAIVLDPSNPMLKLNLGGVYYLLGHFNDALTFFQQAVSLKPDWTNAYYNLAWAYYQNKQFDQAVTTMESTIKLIDKDKAPKDYENASENLKNFRNKLKSLEDEAKTATGEGNIGLPEQKSSLDPKLNLSPESAP